MFDARARRGSARVVDADRPRRRARPRLAMSSLVLVSRAEEIGGRAARSDATGPLYVGRTLLYPNLGEPIRKSAATRAVLLFRPLRRLGRDGHARSCCGTAQLVAEAPVSCRPPPAPASSTSAGCRSGMPAGTYELRIQVTDGRPRVVADGVLHVAD